MYGGLFGDLPAAKGEKSNEKETTNTNIVPQESKDAVSSASSTAKRPFTASFMLPPPAAAARKKPNTTGTASTSSSFSQTIGAAGTSMAFVPATVKRKSRFAKILEAPRSIPPAPTGSALTPAAQAPLLPPATAVSTTTTSTTTAPTTNKNLSLVIAPSAISKTTSLTPAPFSETTSIIQPSQKFMDPIDIHARQEKEQEHLDSNSHAPPQGPTISLCAEKYPPKKREEEDDEEGEEEDNELLEISDPYDPYVPNDLLHYWDRQALLQEQKQLQEETRQALEQQRLLREQLEHERQALQKQGNMEQLAEQVALSMGRGRGRGRGVSNLPAWLEAKQQQDLPRGGDALGESV